MLHIILLILKIIGIILLSILGLLIAGIVIILLVPIRYQIKAEHGDEHFQFYGKVNWLLHMLNARITHLEGVLHIRVRFLCFTLFDNRAPKKPKSKSPKTTSRKKVDHKQIRTGVSKSNILTKDEKKNKEDTGPWKDTLDTTSIMSSKDNRNINDQNGTSGKAAMMRLKDVISGDQKEIKNSKYDDELPPNNENPLNHENEITFNIEKEDDKASSFFQKLLSKLKGVKQKILGCINRVKSWKVRILSFFTRIKEKLEEIFSKIVNIKHKLNLISDFIKDELNRQGFHITYYSLKKLIKHILPQKLKSRIIFGTGDPCSTGQALGLLSILYSFYGDKVQIIPDFENKVFEGKHYARGRIRLITVLIIVIKLIVDKRFKQLKTNFQILKEAL